MTKDNVILEIMRGLMKEGIMADLERREPSIENNTKIVFKIIDESDLNEEDKEELRQIQRDFVKQQEEEEKEKEKEKLEQEEKQRQAEKDKLLRFLVDLKIMDYVESCKDRDDMSIADFMNGIYKIIDDSDLSKDGKEAKKLEKAMIGYEIINNIF